MSPVRYGQRGYIGASKSVRAVQAEQKGRVPITAAAKETGIPAALIRQHVAPCEWHHTSKFANATDYYDIDEILEFFATPEGQAARAEYRPPAKPKLEVEIRRGVTVAWTDWVGQARSRRERVFTSARRTIEIKGDWVTIKLPSGAKRKRRDKVAIGATAARELIGAKHAIEVS